MLAGTLATLAALAGAGLAALAAHDDGLILTHGSVILAVLARIATVATSVGHFIFMG